MVLDKGVPPDPALGNNPGLMNPLKKHNFQELTLGVLKEVFER
jgi:hypothetical protein